MKNNFWILVSTVFIFSLLSSTSVSAFSAEVHISDEYAKVSTGERIYFKVDIYYPENTVRKDLSFEYEIRNKGDIIVHSKVLKAIETQASFMDYLVIPENTGRGLHTLSIKITDYENLNKKISTSFYISNNQIIYIVIIVMLFVLLIGVVIYLVCRRRKK